MYVVRACVKNMGYSVYPNKTSAIHNAENGARKSNDATS
jgi:hypothetical protein